MLPQNACCNAPDLWIQKRAMNEVTAKSKGQRLKETVVLAASHQITIDVVVSGAGLQTCHLHVVQGTCMHNLNVEEGL